MRRVAAPLSLIAALAWTGCLEQAYRDYDSRDASSDSSEPDAGSSDSGSSDAGPPDAGLPDAGASDAGASDAGGVDAGKPDGGADAGSPPDAGRPDAGCPTNPCASGCCEVASGRCQPGTAPAACASNSGLCVDCTTSATGHACGASGCVCLGTADCPSLTVCSNGVCQANCQGGLACNGGCCDGNSSACVAGNTTNDCGPAGQVCTACAVGACFSGTCGCATPSDCPALQACDPATHACSSACNPLLPGCSTGCCDPMGNCVAGSGENACGQSGACLDCFSLGKTCVNGTCQ